MVILSPDGKELEKISVVDTLIDSPYARMVNQVAWYTEGDFWRAPCERCRP